MASNAFSVRVTPSSIRLLAASIEPVGARSGSFCSFSSNVSRICGCCPTSARAAFNGPSGLLSAVASRQSISSTPSVIVIGISI